MLTAPGEWKPACVLPLCRPPKGGGAGDAALLPGRLLALEVLPLLPVKPAARGSAGDAGRSKEAAAGGPQVPELDRTPPKPPLPPLPVRLLPVRYAGPPLVLE